MTSSRNKRVIVYDARLWVSDFLMPDNMNTTHDDKLYFTYTSPLIDVAAVETSTVLCDSGNQQFGHGDADDWFK